MKFAKIEIKDLLKAWLAISFAFAILFSGGFNAFYGLSRLAVIFIISALTAGIGFLLHEIMHKSIAQRYGYKAEFKAFNLMLLLAIGFSFFGFIIAAPGAVMIHAYNISKEKNGRISLAGPLTNLFLAVIFLAPLLYFNTQGILSIFLNLGFKINSLLAIFNLIPIMPFDGKKIYNWSKPVYFAILAAAGILFILSFIF